MKIQTNRLKGLYVLLIAGLLVLLNVTASAQLGVYSFTGTGACPNQNPAVTAQPANATFSDFTGSGVTCKVMNDVFSANELNNGNGVNTAEYFTFTVTPASGYSLNLTSLSFTHFAEEQQNGNAWHLRSGIDNYAADIATADIQITAQSPVVTLPAASFGNTGAVTFRLYVEKMKNHKFWALDDITLNGTTFLTPIAPNAPGDPLSNSPQCTIPGVTLTANGTPPAGETWFWQTTATGTSTTNSSTTLTVNASGTYYLRSRNDASLLWSATSGSAIVAVTPDVAAPAFTLGTTSTRCQAAATTTYTATAANNTSISYSLDAASITGGNSINPTTGAVTFDASWTGASTITATASGCGGPKTATHTVMTSVATGTPVFTLGTSSSRCIAAGTIVYTATATNATALTYSIDAASVSAGNTINASTGAVTYSLLWFGTTTITATATGCGGPKTATHVVTINGIVGTPVFTAGASSTRCQSAGTTTYTATANNSTTITYAIDAASISAGNSINAATGDVSFIASWSGTTTVTATAAGCFGPKSGTHTVTTTALVGTPVFTAGATSTRCQAAGAVTYTATASASTTRSYSLDAASLTGGNTINAATGAVTYVAGWSGSSVITVTATGCNGTSTATHTATINPIVSGLAFNSGATSTRCQGAGTVTYDAAATNTSGITYTLNTPAVTAGNSINATTGVVTYIATWTGATTITATAAGCTPLTVTHTVTTTPTVGNVTFTSGATSTRCQGAATVTYAATATNNTGITYSLDAASVAGNNTINAATGAVTYDAAWTGVSVITATATGCNGPKTATHTATITTSIGATIFTNGNTSTRCQGAGAVAYPATAANATSITYTLDAASITGGNTIGATTGTVTYASGWSGTTTITATAAGCNGPTSATHVVTITPTVGTPVFAAGATSTICQGSSPVTYSATATTNTGITYNIDALSIAAGNTINATTGQVTYVTTWSGTTTVTATATGCNGPKTANHVVTVTATVGTPVFTAGATSTRCQAAGSVTYTATASASTSRSYSLDAASITGGNTINTTTGAVTYVAGWSGTSVITCTAAGCNGPSTATHTVTITPIVSAFAFNGGTTSTRCQGAGPVTYDATATNTTGITYSLSAAAVTAGNSINVSTGVVTYVATWTGATTITATAAGCTPLTATHTVTITPSVGNVIFTSGTTSTRCQGAATITYAATATTNTGITYTLDAASIAGSNTINSSTGAVTYAAGWTGTSVITATATGCNGPKTATHTVTINATVAATIFTNGATSTRCQGTGSVAYPATALNSTSITYSLDAASTAGGNTINSLTGTVAYSATWSGTTTVTATAAGCNGPTSSTHVVTITPTVGTPVFTGGATSTRCQGAGNVTYIAAATNSTGMTYSLDAASITAGNTINATTGAVTYIASWNGSSVITASAAGCNGPKTSTRTESITPTVGTPVFAAGLQSVRTQGAGTNTYTVTATNSTAITYSLDAASITGGNTIVATTGVVTWSAGWYGTSLVTASAAGCNGPMTATHIVNINPLTVQSPLYLSTVATLDRIDPVSTNITTTLQTADLSSTATTNTIFTLNPALCNDLVIKAQTISAAIYVNITSGTMPVSPNITANLSYNGTTIINLTTPVYNSASGILTFTGTLGADVTVPTGQALALKITTAQTGVVFKIDHHSSTKPSRISLLPVSTFIDFVSFDVFNAPYPGGQKRISGNPNTTYYVRAVVTTPFGFKDITGLDLKINPPGNTVPVTCVDSTSCTRTYEYPWTTTASTGTYYLLGTAKEGYENIIKNSELLSFGACTVCAPVAVGDSSTGAGGTPLIVNVLGNDYDPNNNIKVSTLIITGQPNNGAGYISNNKVVYLPNGSFAGRDTLTYTICDSTNLCATGQVFLTINPLLVDPCTEATQTHTYYMPFSENEAHMALDSSASIALVSNNIRTIISIKTPYPGQVIVWDEWEDGYEANALNPVQSTTKVWGDGNPYNGIAPGYPNDIIPASGNIVLDNLVATNPRNPATIYYDGKDKITSSGQIAITQVCGEPSIIGLQCMKTNVSSTLDYGKSFTIPVGEDFNCRDFRYTSLFIRAAEDNTIVEIDKDNNGTLETTDTLSQGEVMLVNGGVKSGATVTSNKDVGVELHFGGKDSYSSRDVPIYPATWYSNTYYSPVPTTGRPTGTVKDSSVVLLYNSLSRPLTINWTTSATPSAGSISIPAKTTVRFPMGLSQTAAYKFTNPTGESFTAIETVDSYTPTTQANVGADFDWSFNLIAENRLTDFATIAWAPGSTDGTRNDNPVWVTPTVNTTVYVKYDGNVGGTTGSISPCGMRYDVSYIVNALTFKRILDPNDNDQSGLAVYTCNGAKLAAVYGEDPSTATAGNPSWDVGSTIQPFCKQKLVFANDDYARTLLGQPVTIPILLNDFGYLAIIDPTSVTNTALLQPKHGSIVINTNGTIIYTPVQGYIGKDTLEYSVCSTPSIVCDIAKVYIDISTCPAPTNSNIIVGNVFLDKNEDGVSNDGNVGVAGGKVYLYIDGNTNGIAEVNELKDSVVTDQSGTFQFTSFPEKTVMDDFDGPGGTRTCANGNDGNTAWAGNWTDIGDPSTGFCNTSQSVANTDAEIVKDGAFSYALRLKDNNVSATRTVNLSGASYAFLSFSYRRKSATMTTGKDVIVQASSNGTAFTPIFTIKGDGTTDAAYVDIYNQDISAFTTTPTTYIRFLTNANMADADTVYIDDIKIQYLKYPINYILKFDSTTTPQYHHTTNALTRSFIATSAQSCFSYYNFGVARNKISLTGTLYHDANGLTDNLINGSAMGLLAGSPVYAYLTDSTGKVVARTSLNPVTGVYTFPSIDVVTPYSVVLSAISVNLGDTPPPDAGTNAIGGSWTPTGDGYGLNNIIGTGIKPGAALMSVKVTTGVLNVTNVNFGAEMLPESDDRIVSYSTNTPNVKYDITGGLTGSDPEDGIYGTGGTYKITSLPALAKLYYNNVVVTLNQVITSFNPALLKIDPDDNVTQTTFTYASRDAAGLYDPTPATVLVRWVSVLPVNTLVFSGILSDGKTKLTWTTETEINTISFDVERSNTGQQFSKLGNVAAHGSPSAAAEYHFTDPAPVNGNNYYRLKVNDNNGASSYSNVVTIRISANDNLNASVRPNPFQSNIEVSFTLSHASKVKLMMFDATGKMVSTKDVAGTIGINKVSFMDLDSLASGSYVLRIITDNTKSDQKLIKF